MEKQWTHKLDEDILRKMASRWVNSIQLSAPKASLDEPAEVLTEAASRFLREPVHGRRDYRSKADAARLARQYIKHALQERGPDLPQRYMKTDHLIDGRLEQHQFEVSIANGRLLFAAQALSFQVQDTRELQRDYEATAYGLSDVRSKDSDVRLAVITYPPLRHSGIYDRAKHVFSKLDAQIVAVDELEGWSRRLVAAIPLNGHG